MHRTPHPTAPHRGATPTRFAAILTAIALAFGAATAQADLRTYAPSESVLSVLVRTGDLPAGDLHDALQELDVAAAFAPFEELTGMADELSGSVGDMLWMAPAPIRELGLLAEDLGGAVAELNAQCPGTGDALEAVLDRRWASDVLLSVAVDPFAIVPGVLAAVRFDDAALADVDAAGDALVACLEPEVLGEQDGTPLYLMGDGSDLPLVFARTGEVWLVGSRPDVVRGALRRAHGADEPTLARTPFGSREVAAPGAQITFAPALLADLLEAQAPIQRDQPDEVHAFERLVALLRTVPAASFTASLTDEGLVTVSEARIDDEAGDPELAALLRCDGCDLAAPTLAPADAVGVSTMPLQASAWVDWLDGLVLDVTTWQRMPTTVRDFLREFAMFDLDASLLSWLGEELQVVALEPFRPDLYSLLSSPPQALLMPVDDEEAARHGVDALIDGVLGALDALAPMDPDVPTRDEAEGWISRTERNYDDVPYVRYRLGPNTDLSVGVVDGHLAMAFPPAAFERIVDVAAGREAAWQAPADAGPLGFGRSDVGAHLHGVVDLLDVLAQPAAFFATTLAHEAADASFQPDPWEPSWDDEEWWLPDAVDLATASGYALDLEGIDATRFEVPGTISAQIAEDGPEIDGDRANLYRLAPAPAGTTVRVTMRSDPIDTYLRLVVPESGGVLQDNDDAPDTNTSILRYVSDGTTEPYVVTTTWGGFETGPYELEVSFEGEESPDVAEPVDPDEAIVDDAAEAIPSFDAFLTLFDLAPDALRIVADRAGEARTDTVLDGSDVRTEQTIPFRW